MTKNTIWMLQYFLQHPGAFSPHFYSVVVAVFVSQLQRGKISLLDKSLKKYTRSFWRYLVSRQVQMNYGSVTPNTSRQNLEPLIFKKIFTQIKPAIVAIANGFAYYANWAVTKTHVRKI